MIKRRFEKTSNDVPMLLQAKDAAHLLGVKLTKFYQLDSSGQLPKAVRLGRTRQWRREEIQEWIRHGCPSREKWQQIKEGGKYND